MIKAYPELEFVGEINERQKASFLGEALALLFPIDWPEPFGLVMIEAMACGTPVIAFGMGSVPEMVDNGGSGFIVHSIDEAVRAVHRIAKLDRASFERRFSVERMARDYEAIYRGLPGMRTEPVAVPYRTAGGIGLQTVA